MEAICDKEASHKFEQFSDGVFCMRCGKLLETRHGELGSFNRIIYDLWTDKAIDTDADFGVAVHEALVKWHGKDCRKWGWKDEEA